MHIPQSSQPSLMIIVYPLFSIKSFGQTGMHFSQTPHSSKSITINISPHKLFFCEFCKLLKSNFDSYNNLNLIKLI